jgi:hypothetical protein
MSNEDLRLWKLQLEHLQNELKEAQRAGNGPQIKYLKREIPNWKNQKPGSSKKGNSSNKSSLWKPLWAFPFKLIWRFTIGLLTDKL